MRVERIGKKYQEIALNVLLCYLDDFYNVREDSIFSRISLDSRLGVHLNDFSSIEDAIYSVPRCFAGGDFRPLLRSVERTPVAFIRKLYSYNPVELITSVFSDSREECVLLGGNCFYTKLWEEGAFGLSSTLNLGGRCWLVKPEQLKELTQMKNIKRFAGNGFAFPSDGNRFLGLYPKAVKSVNCAEENMWVQGEKALRPLNACVSLSQDGDSPSILVPSSYVASLLDMKWNFQHQCFLGGVARAKLYSYRDGMIQALYVSKQPFINAVLSVGFIPVWAFWFEGYLSDGGICSDFPENKIAKAGICELDERFAVKDVIMTDVER